ncbi:hypothetical protein TNCV_302011 [Trichonephila clavipes]|nr:hypothetical protein TNCV_302011 [Trichonephila clavipes]
MPSIGGYHPFELASTLTGLESNRACVGYAWPMNCSPSTLSHLSTTTYPRTLGDGPRHFEPWSSVEDDTVTGIPSPNYHTTPTGGCGQPNFGGPPVDRDRLNAPLGCRGADARETCRDSKYSCWHGSKFGE